MAEPFKNPGAFPPRLSVAESKELVQRRKGRNIALLVVLVAVAALFYAIAIVKLAHPGAAQ